MTEREREMKSIQEIIDEALNLYVDADLKDKKNREKIAKTVIETMREAYVDNQSQKFHKAG